MENSTKTEIRYSYKQKYKAVDVWRSSFGPISVAAIFDVYSQVFRIPVKKVKKIKFYVVVDALRKLEDSDYVAYDDRKIYN